MEMWMIWLIIVFLLIIAEVSTINLVSIWFIASGIVSLIVSIFIDNFYIQFAIFVILGIILLLTTRSFLERLLKNKRNNQSRPRHWNGSYCYRTNKKTQCWRSKSRWKTVECYFWCWIRNWGWSHRWRNQWCQING